MTTLAPSVTRQCARTAEWSLPLSSVIARALTTLDSSARNVRYFEFRRDK